MEILNRSTVARYLVYKCHKRGSVGREIMDDDRCGRPMLKSKTSDVTFCDFPSPTPPKLKGEMKERHLNNLDELKSESTELIFSCPTERFDQEGLSREWIERHRKRIAPQGAYFVTKLT